MIFMIRPLFTENRTLLLTPLSPWPSPGPELSTGKLGIKDHSLWIRGSYL